MPWKIFVVHPLYKNSDKGECISDELDILDILLKCSHLVRFSRIFLMLSCFFEQIRFALLYHNHKYSNPHLQVCGPIVVCRGVSGIVVNREWIPLPRCHLDC